MPARANVVVMNSEGTLIAFEPYNRAERHNGAIERAAAACAERLGITAPTLRGSGTTTDALGNAWGKVDGNHLAPGMTWTARGLGYETIYRENGDVEQWNAETGTWTTIAARRAPREG